MADREAPEAVVAAVQVAMGCEERGGKHRYCYWHGGTEGLWTERGCSVAVRAADAAWAAAYPAALRDAAERLEQRRPHIPPPDAPDRRDRIVQRSTINQASSKLRRWADESETTATEENL